MKRGALFAACCVMACCAQQAQGREWTDSTGRYRAEATLERLEGNQVHLRRDSGTKVVVPLDWLSTADRAFVRAATEKGIWESSPAAGVLVDLSQPAKANGVPIVLAKLQPTPAAPDGAEGPGAGANGDGESVTCEDCCPEGVCEKYVYVAKDATFHLVGRLGTAHYRFKSDPVCNCDDCNLVALKKINGYGPRFLVYTACEGDPYHYTWAFDRKPYKGNCGYCHSCKGGCKHGHCKHDHCKEKFAIWCSGPAGSWHFYGYACREPAGDLW